MEPSSSSSSSSSSSRFPNPLTVFYESLTKGINDLETMLIQTDKNNNENNFMSFKFLDEILYLIRFCHNQMTHWAATLKLPSGGSWFDEYMAGSEMLLKSTKDIKAGIERLNSYFFDCNAIIKFLDTNRVLNPEAVKEMITAITDCTQAADDAEEDNIPLSTKWRDLRHIEVICSNTILLENFGYNGVIYATRNVCKTLLRILFHGLVNCLPQYKFDSYVYAGGKFFDSSFMVSTDKLQKSVESEIYKLTRRTGILWYEFCKSKVTLDKLLREFERVLEGGADVDLESEAGINEIVENLKQYVEVLKVGSESMIEQIDELNDEIIEDRSKIYPLA